MTLFWVQVTLILLATFFHVVGRIYEMKWRQHQHYLAKWDEEWEEALGKADAWSLVGEHAKANEQFARLRVINRKYTMFFDSIN